MVGEDDGLGVGLWQTLGYDFSDSSLISDGLQADFGQLSRLILVTGGCDKLYGNRWGIGCMGRTVAHPYSSEGPPGDILPQLSSSSDILEFERGPSFTSPVAGLSACLPNFSSAFSTINL